MSQTATQPAAQPSSSLSGSRRSLVLALLCAGIFVVYLDSTIVNVALPTIGRDLRVSISGLQWIIDAYVLTFACLLLSAGVAGDVFGRKRVFLVGLAGFTALSAVCAIAPSVGALTAARAAQGAFGSVMMPISLALVTGLYADPAARARAIGIWAGVGGLALAVGPVAGGALVDHYGWQSIFWLNVPVGVITGLGLVRFLPATAPRATARHFDLVGQILFITGAALLTYALIEGGPDGWGSPGIVSAFVAAAIAWASFLWWETRATAPMLPPRILRNATVLAVCGVNLVLFFGLYTTLFLLTLHLQKAQGLTAAATGVRFLALTIAIMVASFLGPIVASRTGPRITVTAGALIAAVGLAGLTGLSADTGFFSYAWGLVLIGAGGSLAGAPATVVLLSSVPANLAGTASGTYQTFRQIGAVLGVAVAGALIGTNFIDGLRTGFWMAAALTVAAALLAVLMMPGKRDGRAATD